MKLTTESKKKKKYLEKAKVFTSHIYENRFLKSDIAVKELIS